MSVPADWTGKRVGRIKVLKLLKDKDKWGSLRWETQCDCGVIIIKTSKRLSQMKKRVENGAHTGCRSCVGKIKAQYISALPPHNKYEDRSFAKVRAKATSIMSRAKRKKGVSLSIEQIHELIKHPCYYCGLCHIEVNGLDRIDSSGIYSKDNVVPCCPTCNKMKNILTTTEFYAYIRRIYAYIK